MAARRRNAGSAASSKVSQIAHGSNAAAVILLALRQTWAGDLVEGHWLYEGLSRGRARVYVFMEDLSRSIRLPPGDLREAGAELGLQPTQYVRHMEQQSLVKKQLRLLRLLTFCRETLGRTTSGRPGVHTWYM